MRLVRSWCSALRSAHRSAARLQHLVNGLLVYLLAAALFRRHLDAGLVDALRVDPSAVGAP